MSCCRAVTLVAVLCGWLRLLPQLGCDKWRRPCAVSQNLTADTPFAVTVTAQETHAFEQVLCVEHFLEIFSALCLANSYLFVRS